MAYNGHEWVWLAVTPDKYELPLVAEASAELLARKLGVTKNAVMSGASQYKKGKESGNTKGYRVTRVELIEENEINV